MSTTTPGPQEAERDVFTILEEARVDFPSLVADADNPFTKSRYATLGAVKAAVGPALRAHQLGVFQVVRGNELLTELRYLGPLDVGAARSILSTYPLVVNDNPQQAASSITYARRYALTTLLDLVVDKDDDGNAASGRSPQAPADRAVETPLPELPTGWDDHAQCQAAHRALTDRIVSHASDQLTASAREFRQQHGWPLTVERFNELEDLVRIAEKLGA